MERLYVSELRKDLVYYDVQQQFCEYDNGYICDIISEIADRNIDIYNCDLFEWAKKHWEEIDYACQEFGMPDSKDTNIIIKLIQQGQFYYYEQLLYEYLDNTLLNFCYYYVEHELRKMDITEEQQQEIEDKCTNVDNNDRLEDYTEFLDELFEEIKE